MEKELVVFYLYPGGLFTLSANYKSVISRLFQIKAEIAPTVGGGRYACERREGGDIKAV